MFLKTCGLSHYNTIVETGILGLKFLFLFIGELGEACSVNVHGIPSLRGSATSSSEWLSSAMGFHPKISEEILFLILFSVGLRVDPAEV